jgi:predicted RNA-binding protein YlxR (DUF448 family)
MCVVCRGRFRKSDILRFVAGPGAPEGTGTGSWPAGLVPDPGQVLPGRGVYVCGRAECLARFARFRGPRRKCKGDDA